MCISTGCVNVSLKRSIPLASQPSEGWAIDWRWIHDVETAVRQHRRLDAVGDADLCRAILPHGIHLSSHWSTAFCTGELPYQYTARLRLVLSDNCCLVACFRVKGTRQPPGDV